MEFPKQEHKTGNTQRATVCKRDAVTIRRDNAAGGASNPVYDRLLAANVMAEIIQVSGGEMVRGRQVEANTQFVVTVDYVADLLPTARCEIEILSGIYVGQFVYTKRIEYETGRARPMNIQLHCGAKE